MKLQYGISTWYAGRAKGASWEESLETAYSFSSDAVEITALKGDELEGKDLELLDIFLKSESFKKYKNLFKHISLHGPNKEIKNEEELIEILKQFSIHFDYIVMHPDVLINIESWQVLGNKLLIENMDPRRKIGKTAEELETVFNKLPEAGFCFDIGHAAAVDPSLKEGYKLIEKYANRLKEIHISHVDKTGIHSPLNQKDAELFSPLLSKYNSVCILENNPSPTFYEIFR